MGIDIVDHVDSGRCRVFELPGNGTAVRFRCAVCCGSRMLDRRVPRADLLTDCGQGFIKDDYGWIANSRLDGVDVGLAHLQTRQWGSIVHWFRYRSARTRSLFGLNPLPYGLTNLGLVILTAFGVGWLVNRLGFPSGIALRGGLYLDAEFPRHWHSRPVDERTHIAARNVGRCRRGAVRSSPRDLLRAGIFTLLAVFSKEEPLLLPVVFWRGSPSMIARSTAAARRRSTAGRRCFLLRRPQCRYSRVPGHSGEALEHSRCRRRRTFIGIGCR